MIQADRSLFINPLLLVFVTFGGGFLFWYFGMPDTSFVPGVAPRHESTEGLFLFFLYFSAFTGGMMMAQGAPGARSGGVYLSDELWLKIGWATGLIVVGADFLYLRGGAASVGSLDTQSYSSAIHEFSSAVRDNAAFGVTSFNNLFPVPLVIGAALMMTRRTITRNMRWQGAAIFGAILLMTLVHGVTGFGRIWFLFSIMVAFVVWVIERQPRLRLQIVVVTFGVLFAGVFIVIVELLRSAGLSAQAANLSLTDTRIVRLAFLTLTQAYVGSDVNNAMIVFDCSPPMSLISTIDILFRPLQNIGITFPTYMDCPGWTSIFGTINFFATMWWDWGLVGAPLTLGIGYAIQRSYLAAVRPLAGLGFGEVLFPNVLFGAAHLTRTVFLGSTEFLLPAGLLLLLFMVVKVGAKAPVPATA